MLQTSFDYNILEVFLVFFREMIGDLNDFDDISQEVDYLWVLYFFFFTATILLTIAMLNLLIAIISDTFSKVKNAEELTKIWERWNIITEIDEILFEKNKNNKLTAKKYLLFLSNDCHFKKEITEINEVEIRMNSKLESIDTRLLQIEKNFEKVFLSLDNLQNKK